MNNKDDDEFSEEGIDDELDLDLSEREKFRRET
eukprot:CAMPEP_0168313990 /NCGR_PEP_ID=MMETSP0210-20121227/5722_1 /TAXON_ID=40633 /ORGANISM="Condylostoma magnum, Strain COL2" /LENGTH=32 /DNA_ID= /DNA_START= /DNA_END= /DNA_ORIENTATION=